MTDNTIEEHRSRNPRGQGDRLREEILRAANRLLSELGSEEAVTIRGVARLAGIAPASMYQHFADKAALVRGVIDYDFRQLFQALEDADVLVDPDDTVGRLRAQTHAYCRFALENPGHYRLMLRSLQLSEPRRSLASVVEIMTGAFRRCEEAGHRLRVPSERAAVMVFVGAHGRVALHHSDPADHDLASILAFVDELVALAFDERLKM